MDYKISDIATAKKNYIKTFKQKSGKSKGYMPIRMKTVEEIEEAKALNEEPSETTEYAESKLHPRVKTLIDFIYNKDLMNK